MSTSSSLVLLAGRHCFDDPNRLERSVFRDEHGHVRRGGFEDEEAGLVLGDMDGMLEPDAPTAACQVGRCRTSTLLLRRTLVGRPARKVRLDEITRHAVDARAEARAPKRQ